jgi:hypothetical protein
MIMAVLALSALAAGTAIAVMRFERHQAVDCHRVGVATACANAAHSVDTGASLGVVIDSSAVFGWREPTAIAVCRGAIWVADGLRDSLTSFGWQVGSVPVTLSGARYRLSGPHAITAGGDRLWVANTDSITEISAISGKVVRFIAQAATRNVGALILFGHRLWVASARNLVEINAGTGGLIAVFGGRRYGFDRPVALAISDRRLWVANAGDGSVTEMDATTGRWIATLAAAKTGVSDPIAETADQTMLWVASNAAGSVSQIDTATGRLVRVIGGARYGMDNPAAMAVAGDRLWITNAGNNTVTEIDTRTGKLAGFLDSARFGFAGPAGIVAYRDRLWITNEARGSVTELVPRLSH